MFIINKGQFLFPFMEICPFDQAGTSAPERRPGKGPKKLNTVLDTVYAISSTKMVSINQSWGAYAGGRVASPTLRRHSWRSRLASLHTGPLPIPSSSQQEASTCRSQEFCGCPLGLLQVGLSLTETTRQAGAASGYRATCPYSRSWR